MKWHRRQAWVITFPLFLGHHSLCLLSFNHGHESFFTSIFYHSQDVGFYLRQFIFHKLNKYNKAPASLVSKELKPAKKFHPEYPKHLYWFIVACSAFTISERYFFFCFFLSCLNIGVLVSNPPPSHNVSATFRMTDPFLEWTLAW